MAALVSRANRDYLPWEKVKYSPLPGGLAPETLWALVKWSRLAQPQRLPMTDSQGRPFTFWISDSILRDLHFIDQNAGGQLLMDHSDLPVGARDRYLVTSLIEEAIASSQIEGAATTRKVAKEMLRTGRRPTNYAEQMIYNNYSTINRIRNLIGKPLTIDVLHEIQSSMTEGTLEDPSAAGRFRRPEEPVHVVDRTDGTVMFTPPPAESIPERLDRFLRFANDTEEEPFIHPVIRGILLHFWLAYEHPYTDGNGRTARAIFYWYMLSRQYWLFEFLSISRAILRSRAQYDRAFLHAEQDDLDANYFLVYHLQAVRQALQDMRHYLHRKQEEMAEATKRLRKLHQFNYRQRALLQHALKHPDFIYTIQSHRISHDVAYGTARSDLLSLGRRGLLRMKRAGREFRFEPVANLADKLR